MNVDIASYKAEFLSHYWKGRTRPLRSYAFGWIDKWAQLASLLPGATNAVTGNAVVAQIAKSVLGIAPQRKIPSFAASSFRSWFIRRELTEPRRPAVLLWPDTFNNYFRPATAQAATEVLEEAGYQVTIPSRHLCCGRPLYDHGFLGMAKTYLMNVVSEIESHIAAGLPIIVLEPSCCSVFRDEMRDLLPNVPAAQKMATLTVTLAEFLETRATHFSIPRLARKGLVQGHCHHKSVMRMDADTAILGKLGLDYRMIEGGCCGMAGAFGYEKEKFALSQACAERVLFPSIREADPSTVLIADGFSCRTQIEQTTGRNTFHLAEIIRLACRSSSGGAR